MMAVIAFLEDKIYDLQAFVGVIAAYPVHIMTVMGSVLLFFWFYHAEKDDINRPQN